MMNAIVFPIYCPLEVFDFGATNNVFEVDERIVMMICCWIEIFNIELLLHSYLVLIFCIVQENVIEPRLAWEDPLFPWI